MLTKTLEITKKKKRISNTRKFSIISYGCQMNVSDSEVVASILEGIGYTYSNDINESDLILLNTCSIREKAEITVRKKLETINAIKKNKKNLKVGVLGCMAERLKEKFLIEEKIVDKRSGIIIKDIDKIKELWAADKIRSGNFTETVTEDAILAKKLSMTYDFGYDYDELAPMSRRWVLATPIKGKATSDNTRIFCMLTEKSNYELKVLDVIRICLILLSFSSFPISGMILDISPTLAP